MKHIKLYEEFITEKKPAGAPDWKDSDAPDAEGRFRDLGIKDLATWLIKTRKGDLKKISGSLTQQVVFNREEDPAYAEKMEKVRQEVYKQLDRKDLIESDLASVRVLMSSACPSTLVFASVISSSILAISAFVSLDFSFNN